MEQRESTVTPLILKIQFYKYLLIFYLFMILVRNQKTKIKVYSVVDFSCCSTNMLISRLIAVRNV